MRRLLVKYIKKMQTRHLLGFQFTWYTYKCEELTPITNYQ